MNAIHYIGFDVHKKSIAYCVKTAKISGRTELPLPTLRVRR
jgi:hypothetical protein